MEQGRVAGFTILFLLAATLWMLWPLFDALLFGVFTAYVFTYLKRNTDRKIQHRKISWTLITFFMVVVVGGFLYGISTSITLIGENFNSFVEVLSGSASFVTELFEFPEPVSGIVTAVIRDVAEGVRSGLFTNIGGLTKGLIDVFIFLVSTVYFFLRGERIRDMIFTSIDYMDKRTAEFVQTVLRSIYDLFTGVFLFRALNAFSILMIASVGLYFMDVNFWWGWASLMAAFNFIPLLGPSIVYIPLGFLYMGLGDFWLGVVIILYGIIFLDTLPAIYIRPGLEVPRVKEPPLLLFLGLFAGPLVMGPKGIFLGPAVLILAKDMLMHIHHKH